MDVSNVIGDRANSFEERESSKKRYSLPKQDENGSAGLRFVDEVPFSHSSTALRSTRHFQFSQFSPRICTLLRPIFPFL